MTFLFIPRVKTAVRDQQQQVPGPPEWWVPAVRLFSHLAFLLPQRRLGWSNLPDLDHHHVSCREKQHLHHWKLLVGTWCLLVLYDFFKQIFWLGSLCKDAWKERWLNGFESMGWLVDEHCSCWGNKGVTVHTLFKKSFRNRRTSNWNPGTSHPNIIWVVATQIFFIFTPIWGRFPFWLIFFKGVETTN